MQEEAKADQLQEEELAVVDSVVLRSASEAEADVQWDLLQTAVLEL
jgi:hypothetical protein